MSHFKSSNSTVPLLALTCLILATACAKSKSEKAEPRLPVDNVQLMGGVGQKHRLLVARPNAQLTVDKQDSVLQLDAEASIAALKVVNTKYIAVESNSCSDNVCTVTYSQSETAGEKDEISLTLRILDANGTEWKEVQAVVLAAPLQVSALPAFVPNFGQIVSLTLPVALSDRPNDIEPKLAQLEATGGRIESTTCEPSSCRIDFRYDTSNVQPIIRFALNNNTRLSQIYTITPQPETFSFIKRSLMVVDGTNIVKIQKGVDYHSSWNRPAHIVKVKNNNGLTAKPFACAPDACVAEIIVQTTSSNPFLEYSLQSFGNESPGNRQELTRTTATFRGLLQEAVIEYGKDNLITLRPGQEYESNTGVLPGGLRVTGTGLYNSTVTNAKCGLAGICSFNLKHDSNNEFFTLNYSFFRGTYESPPFTMKLRPFVKALNTDISVWQKDADEWSELVLEAGPNKDYVSEDGQLATSIIVKSADNLVFKDVRTIAESAESIFKCDAAGVCRAWVKNTNSAFSTSISYRVRTADHASQLVQRRVFVRRDSTKLVTVAGEHAFRKVQLTDASSNLYSFDLSFAHGTDYRSRFPATHMLVTLGDEETITIDTPHEKEGTNLVVKCDEVCPLSGSFISKNLHRTVRVAFRNDYTGATYGDDLYMIDENHVGIFPDMASYKTITVHTGTSFTITFENGPKLGYVGDKLAKAIRLRNSQEVNFNQGTPGQDVFGDYREFTCNAQGACVVQATVSNIYPLVSYYFVDTDGQSSIQRNVVLSTPEEFAPPISADAAIQSDLVEIHVYNFWRALGSETVEIFDSQDQVLGSLDCEYRNRCKGRIKLSAPLTKVGEAVELGYRRKFNNDVKSEDGVLKLTGSPTYRLKKDLVKTAQKLDRRKYKFTISLADLDILDASPASWPLDDTTTLSFDVNGIIISQKACDRNQCEFTLVNVPENVSSLKVSVIRPQGYFSRTF
ncbi:MAG: hypothetical protein M3Q07_05610, partial [Pseudobdellovibrionaceae bacterium]|nr:hypothetical protein [Pseudobdellovibrionaceae bacterium]